MSEETGKTHGIEGIVAIAGMIVTLILSYGVAPITLKNSKPNGKK